MQVIKREACRTGLCFARDPFEDIVRDLIIHGPCTYSALLESRVHISTNILADNLDLLTSLELIEGVNPDQSARRFTFEKNTVHALDRDDFSTG
jgi:hypothetical protein